MCSSAQDQSQKVRSEVAFLFHLVQTTIDFPTLFFFSQQETKPPTMPAKGTGTKRKAATKGKKKPAAKSARTGTAKKAKKPAVKKAASAKPAARPLSGVLKKIQDEFHSLDARDKQVVRDTAHQ